MAMEWNGAASMKPCLRHWNVVRVDTNLCHRNPAFVEISSADHWKFANTRATDLHNIVDSTLAYEQQWEAGGLSKGRLDALIKASGFCCSKNGLLADRALRARIDFVRVTRYDWMRATLQCGTLSIEAGMPRCRSLGVGG